jgi:hypothetical protein
VNGFLEGLFQENQQSQEQQNLLEDQRIQKEDAESSVQEHSKSAFTALLERAREKEAANPLGETVADFALENWGEESNLVDVFNKGREYYERFSDAKEAWKGMMTGDINEEAVRTYTSATPNLFIREVQEFSGTAAVRSKDAINAMADKIDFQDFSEADYQETIGLMNPLKRFTNVNTQQKPWTLKDVAVIGIGGVALAGSFWIGVGAAAWYGFNR